MAWTLKRFETFTVPSVCRPRLVLLSRLLSVRDLTRWLDLLKQRRWWLWCRNPGLTSRLVRPSLNAAPWNADWPIDGPSYHALPWAIPATPPRPRSNLLEFPQRRNPTHQP